MKRVLLAALIAMNVVLLVCVLHVNSPAAHAQAARGAPDYLAVTARVNGSGKDALFLLHLGQRKMVAWVPNVSTGRLEIVGRAPSDLRRDFGRDKSQD
jgi:hypothetical protein